MTQLGPTDPPPGPTVVTTPDTLCVEKAVSVEMACNTVVVTVVVTLWVTLAGRLAGGQAGHMGQEVIGRSQAGTVGTTGGERVGGMANIGTI